MENPSNHTVLLSTAVGNVLNNSFGTRQVRSQLNSGDQINLVASKCYNAFGFSYVKSTTYGMGSTIYYMWNRKFNVKGEIDGNLETQIFFDLFRNKRIMSVNGFPEATESTFG